MVLISTGLIPRNSTSIEKYQISSGLVRLKSLTAFAALRGSGIFIPTNDVHFNFTPKSPPSSPWGLPPKSRAVKLFFKQLIFTSLYLIPQRFTLGRKNVVICFLHAVRYAALYVLFSEAYLMACPPCFNHFFYQVIMPNSI